MIFSRQLSLAVGLIAGAVMLAQPVKAMPVLSFDFTPSAVAFNAGSIDFDTDSLFDDFSIGAQVGDGASLVGLTGEINGIFGFTATGEVTSTA